MPTYDPYTPSGSPRTYKYLNRLQAMSFAAVSKAIIDGVDAALSALDTVIATKAPLASPALTGAPTAPTAPADTSTTQVATTAFVTGQAGSSSPVMNGAAAVGTSMRFARQDHAHPSDTTKVSTPSGGTDGQALLKSGSTVVWGDAAVKRVLAPLFVSPLAGTINLGPTVTLVSSPIQFDRETSAHASSDWQVASDAAFTAIIASVTASTSALTAWTTPSLSRNTVFYARVRYAAADARVSPWSPVISFSTRQVYVVRNNGLAWFGQGAASPDAYFSMAANGTDGVSLSGNTGYARQTSGLAVTPLAQALMRRCVLRNDGSGVVYYLDCDDSTKIAGTWSGNAQTGWLRVHEGFADPVRPIPGQGTSGSAALRALAGAWSSAVPYTRGDLVTSGGKLWVSLSDSNLAIAPASGTSASNLTGATGQVMVEIPRFYVYRAFDAGTKRRAWDIAIEPAECKPFPDLTVASTAPTTKVIDGLTFTVHPAFQKAGVERSHRYLSAYRAYDNGTILQSVTAQTYCNNKTRGAYRSLARARNTGLIDPSGSANNVWALRDFYLNSALSLLFLLEYRTFYAQAVLGGGNQSGTDYAKTTGRSNTGVANASGAYSSGVLVTPNPANDDDGVAYRGIEDFYGSMWDWTDGYNGLGNGSTQAAYLSNTPANFADDTSTNYAATGLAIPAMSGSYVSDFHDSVTFLPSSITSGSSSTYATDGGWQAAVNGTWYGANVSGNASDGAIDGAFTLSVNVVSSAASSSLGAALAR